MGWLTFLLFAVLVVLLTLLLRFGILWMGRAVGRQTRTRFEEAESILNENTIPAAWLDEVRDLHPEEGRKRLLKRLSTLTEFFQNAPVVADETSRQVLLDGLAVKRNEWSQADWEKLSGGSHPSSRSADR